MIKRLVVILLWAVPCFGQAWSGVIDPSRAMDWKNVGISAGNYGNVPHNTTLCSTLGTAGQASTFAQSVTAAQINSAIATCGTNQVVFLNTGTYSLAGAINFAGHSNVTLRGAGPTNTIIKFSSGSGCTQGPTTDVCIESSSFMYTGSIPHLTTWTAGFAVGTTVVTLGSVSGLSPGQLLILDQQNDQNDTSQVFVCDNQDSAGGNNPTGALVGCDNAGNGPTGTGRTVGGIDYSQQQMVKVISIAGNNVTIDTALYMPNWNNAKPHGAWWDTTLIQNSGIENLTLDHTNSTGGGGLVYGIEIANAYGCWVKNIRGLFSNRANVEVQYAAHLVIRDSYFYGTQNAQSQSYGVEMYQGSDVLVINNIFQHVTSPILYNANEGVVDAYNYMIDMFNAFGSFASSSFENHAAGADMYLTEGSEGTSWTNDIIHGSHNFGTVFRSFMIGPDVGKTANTMTVSLQSFSRYFNIVGNVFGKAGYANTYQNVTGGSTSGCDTAIYNLGFSRDQCGSDGASPPGVPADPLTSSTLMRWGNWDVVNNATRFVNAEVPSGISPFANPVPGNNNLPTSFFLVSGGVPYTNPPTWWATAYGTPAWPAIGPDVTGGTVTSGTGTGSTLGGHVYLNPAALCQQNLPQDATNYPSTVIKAFDAATCYPSESATTPDSPQGGAPSVGLVPTSIAFGNQSVSTTSTAQSVTLTNTGTAALSISSISLTGTNSSEYSIFSNTCPTSLGVGSNCVVSVTFSPAAIGSRVASLRFTTNASTSPDNVNLTGTGTAPIVSLSTTSVNFFNQLLSTTSSIQQVVVLTNTGNVTLTMSSTTLGGANAGDFAAGGATTCSTSLAAGNSCNYAFTFTPSVLGSRSATFSITDNAAGSPHIISLAGTGVNPVSGLGSITGTGIIKINP